MARDAYGERDLTYIRANYFRLEELCAGRSETLEDVQTLVAQGALPAPSYVLDDGTGMFPADYFVLVDQAGGPERLRLHFAARHRAAGGDPAELEEDWQGYIDGLYGVCLRSVIPEVIVRKSELVASLEHLLAEPAPANSAWRRRLRREVWELDALERDFAPDYDRSCRFERPPTRDLLIVAARDRYAELFATEERAQ